MRVSCLKFFRKTIQNKFLIAIRNGDIKLAKYFVEKGVDFRARDNYAIRLACFNGHLKLVKYLVELGVDFRVYDNDPICLASRNGHLNIKKSDTEFTPLEHLTTQLVLLSA